MFCVKDMATLKKGVLLKAWPPSCPWKGRANLYNVSVLSSIVMYQSKQHIQAHLHPLTI